MIDDKKLFTTVEDVDRLVRYFHDNDFIHRKRGYSLKSATFAMAGIHLMEEATEFVAACVAPDGMKLADKQKPRYQLLLEEAGDLLGCFLHLSYMAGLPLSEIVKRAAVKLDDVFVLPTDP